MEKNNVSTDDFANPKLSKNDESVNNLSVNNMNNDQTNLTDSIECESKVSEDNDASEEALPDRIITILKSKGSIPNSPRSIFPIISAKSLNLEVNLLLDPCNEITLVSKDLVKAVNAKVEIGPKIQIEGINLAKGCSWLVTSIHVTIFVKLKEHKTNFCLKAICSILCSLENLFALDSNSISTCQIA